MTLKKYLRSGSGQAAVEYFILLAVIAGITLISLIRTGEDGILDRIIGEGNRIFDNAANATNYENRTN